ncbi:MAG: helix-turn-helix domain-containing protein [Phascolarctobacterium sp.]
MQDKHYLIGQRIKEIRMQRGMSQSKAAEAIGVAQSHMSNIETGRSHVTMENLMALRDVFGVKMADFFVDLDYPKAEGEGEGAAPAEEALTGDQAVTLSDLIEAFTIIKGKKSGLAKKA